ncbi:sensor histidine kinase [Paucihalobacter sp.]|uniref:sensor histidine kinase n=1 Tax=Paucihalobacter sp. TaxID=2850405 RepID=UPI003D1612EA
MYSSFEHLTQLAAVLAEASTASLMLTSKDKLICKSSVGISSKEIEPYVLVFTASLAKNVEYDCNLNMHEDARWDSLLDKFETIKSYHSYLIKSKNGKPIGILVLLKHEEKELAGIQIQGLKLLSKQVIKLLKLKKKNKSLKKHQRQLAKTSKKLDDFASMAAHDLKAPIRNIKSFMNLLKSEQDWSEDITMYFDYIDTSITKMNLLIDGLMDYAKIDNNDANAETVNLDQLVTNALKDCAVDLENSVSLTKEFLPVIYSFPILLLIAVHNLINNAIKYNKSHPIEITVAYKAENGFHSLAFSDNGIGIDAAYFDEIFKPFKRLHTQSEFEGSGLGLATCKRIMKNLKGSISVNSALGRGSTFTIKIPIIEQL